MQKDNYTDFDLQLRSMLREAEEELPSLAWESLSAELDRRDRRKVVALRWRRAAAGFAAAAAVVSAVFFAMDRGKAGDSNSLQPILAENSSVVSPALPDKTTSEESIVTIEEQIAASAERMLADVPAPPIKGNAFTVPDAVIASDIVAIPESAQTPEALEIPDAAETAADSGISGKTENRKEEEEWVDHFARLEYEESLSKQKKQGLSLYLEGNAASNEKNANAVNGPLMSGSTGVKSGITEKNASTYGIPLSFGLGARFNISDRFSVGTGINWSLLSRSFSGIYTEMDGKTVVKSVNSNISNELHYIGIPLNLYYNLMSDRNMKLYVWGGGSVEKGLVNRYRIYSQPKDIIYKEAVKGVQWSVVGGVGLEFTLNDRLGLYFDPSARYYFDCGQPNSIRTMKHYMMNFEVGLRFNL